MTNVNPGNRDPRKGRFGSSRKFFSRDKSDDLLQDRDELADDLGQDYAPEHYETTGDGSFGEALDEYYDSRDDRELDRRELDRRDLDQPESAPRGRHHRRDDHEDEATPVAGGYAAQTESRYDDYVDAEYEPEYPEYTDTRRYERGIGENSEYPGPEHGATEYSEYEDYADYDEYADNDDYADYRDDRSAVAAAPAAGTAAQASTAQAGAAQASTVQAGTAGTGAAAGGSSTAAAAGGVPKRGLAMILIAVALLLALWGVYAMTKGGSDNQAANETNQSAQDPNNPNGQNQNGQGQNPNDPNAANQTGNGQAQDGQAQNGQGQNGQAQDGQGQDGQGQDAQNRGNGAAPAGANNPMTQENMTVNVYNNSAITGFADQVAGQVQAKGTKVGEVGNIPGEVVTFGQNTVLFDPATPGAEDRARELADKVGGIAIPNDDSIPAEAKKPGSLTLVLAENREVVL